MNNRKKIVIAIAVVATLIASIIVIRYPSPLGSIIVPDDYPSIQAAADHAFTGQTIFVRSGVYTEQNIVINKPLSLVGENPNNTILIGINTYRYNPPYVVQISADNVKISGFTIKSGDLGGIRVETIGSATQPNGVVITGNIVANNDGDGISTYGGINLIISNNYISNNGQFGLYDTSSYSSISQNAIIGNSGGVIVDSCNNVTIDNNLILNNGNGIALRWNGNFSVNSNNVTNNSGYGIEFGEGCNNSTVYSNNIDGNAVGINLLNFAITKSMVNNSDIIGIGTNDKVYQNNIDNLQNAFVQTAFPYGNITTAYEAIGNGTDVLSWDNDSVGNYWSDYTGNGTYVIDKNNIDHHPLTQPVNVLFNVPTLTPLVTGISLTIPLLLLVIAIVVGLVTLLLFRKHRKTAPAP